MDDITTSSRRYQIPAAQDASNELPELGSVLQRYRKRTRIIKALAHPTRLYILDQLACGPRCVCELTALIGADASTVSRHLSVLHNAGILDFEKRGSQVWYHLCTPCLLNIMYCVENVIANRASGPEGTLDKLD